MDVGITMTGRIETVLDRRGCAFITSDAGAMFYTVWRENLGFGARDRVQFTTGQWIPGAKYQRAENVHVIPDEKRNTA